MGVKDNLIYEECMKELNTMFTRKEKRSFGEYFDDQRDRIVNDMQTGKNTELYNAWREDYDKRQREKKERTYRKELLECSEKGVEISEECKLYFKKQFETSNEKSQTIKTMKQRKIVKEFKEKGKGEFYLEFSSKELAMFGLEKGDSVEWMQLEDREVWKKLVKKRWSI